MTDDRITLASTYLDGECTAAERAHVEADPALVVEVERLRQVRAVLGDTETAPISMRERHLAAALDAWDRVPSSERLGDATPAGAQSAAAAGGASITAPTTLRDRRSPRRHTNTKLLTAAAAVIVLAGAGIVVRGALDSGSSTNDSSADSAATFEVTADAELRAGPVEAAEETFGTESAEGEQSDIAAAPNGAGDAILGSDEAPAEDDLEVLSSNDDLAEFANAKVLARATQAEAPAEAASESDSDQVDSSDEPANSDASGSAASGSEATTAAPLPTLAPPVDLCGFVDEFVGFALWDSSGLFDDPIAIGIDNRTDDAVAYQYDPCDEIARTSLP